MTTVYVLLAWCALSIPVALLAGGLCAGSDGTAVHPGGARPAAVTRNVVPTHRARIRPGRPLHAR